MLGLEGTRVERRLRRNDLTVRPTIPKTPTSMPSGPELNRKHQRSGNSTRTSKLLRGETGNQAKIIDNEIDEKTAWEDLLDKRSKKGQSPMRLRASTPSVALTDNYMIMNSRTSVRMKRREDYVDENKHQVKTSDR